MNIVEFPIITSKPVNQSKTDVLWRNTDFILSNWLAINYYISQNVSANFYVELRMRGGIFFRRSKSIFPIVVRWSTESLEKKGFPHNNHSVKAIQCQERFRFP